MDETKVTPPPTVGKIEFSPSSPAPKLPASGSLSAAVSAGLAQKVNVPAGLKLSQGYGLDYFHGMLYGDTGAYKTTTAFEFGGRENTFIVLSRSPEQLKPIRSLSPHFCVAEDSDAFMFALQFPEKAADAAGFPQWKDNPNRVLMVDDMTEGTALNVDENSVKDDGSDVKDGRKIYGGVKDDIRACMLSLKKKRMHLVMTALAEVYLSPIDNDETIFPAMPKGARSIITAELEYVFYIKHETKKMLTDRHWLTYTKKDEKTGKPVMAKRDIFAKAKVSRELVGRVPPVIKQEEDLDLRALWSRICAAQSK